MSMFQSFLKVNLYNVLTPPRTITIFLMHEMTDVNNRNIV